MAQVRSFGCNTDSKSLEFKLVETYRNLEKALMVLCYKDTEEFYICEFFSDFLRMDSVESSLKSFSIVETSESRMARPKPRAANTYSTGLRALLM